MNRIFTYPASIYRNNRNIPGLPRLLTYIVTYRCNARCVMCGSWEKTGIDELTIEEIKNIFSQLPKLDAVRLTGGEPFLRTDFDSIVMLAQKILKPFSLFISSNGFLTDRIIKFCENRDKGVRLNIIISLDGFREKHNSVRGRAYAWESAVETISELAKHGKKFKCNVLVNQTILDEESIEQYRPLREYLKKYGLRNNIVVADKSTGAYSTAPDSIIRHSRNGGYNTFGNFSIDSLDKFFREVMNDLKESPLTERVAKKYYVEGIKNRLLYNKKIPYSGCVALNSHIRLLPDGIVPVCQFNTNAIGNLRKDTFVHAWNGDVRNNYLDWVHKCPGCWAECENLPSAVYSGGLIKYKLDSICRKYRNQFRVE